MTTETESAPEPEQGWYAKAWLAHFNKRQADLFRDLGWDRSRVSKVMKGQQPFTRDDLLQVAAWLGIEPYELLMSPALAIRYRTFRDAAFSIVAETSGRDWGGPPGDLAELQPPSARKVRAR